MKLFGRSHQPPAKAPAETSGQREQREARERIVSDLAGRLHDSDRVDQVRALPGGSELVSEAVRRAARDD
jgi:hypothetical protein